MKQESVVKYILRLALTLLLITGVVAAALAGINNWLNYYVYQATPYRLEDIE